MGGDDLSDQTKATYEVDCRSKFCFYLRVFFDFLDIASSIQKSFTIKLNQHLHYLHSTFDKVLHKLLYGSFQAEKELFRYPDHRRGQEAHHLTLWIIYLTLHPLEFVVPFVHQGMSKVELTYAV